MRNLHRAVGFNIFTTILIVYAASSFAFAADVGTVTYVEGRVDTLSSGSDMGMPLRQGDTIAVGDALRTKSNSKLEVTFNDKSVLRVAQNSKVVVKDYQLDASNRRQAANILLERGKARTIIAKMPRAADFIISTPNASGSVKGSDIFTSYQAGNSGMLVAEGKLSVVNTLKPEPAVIIPAGSAVVVSLEETPKGPRQYFETEKKMYEQDTEIPATIARTPGASEIKGAIAKLSGDVRVTFKKTGETREASINDILEAGDTIATGDNGMVEIKFDNGNGINLKPNSDIKINSLVMDAKTGEYENLFESTKGRIRSRIEGLKGKSKFEIKTPVAVSGARGTIMYLEITPTRVRAFFEGGRGSLMSLISGIEKMVEAGENAWSDVSGLVSESMRTPESERTSWGEGWTPGNGTEGYSAPDGSTGVYLSNEGGNIDIVERVSTENFTGPGNDGPLNDPLLNPIFGSDEEGNGEGEEEIGVTAAGWMDGSVYSTETSGSFNGLVTILGNFWDGNSAQFSSAGDFYGGAHGQSFSWSGPLYSYYTVSEGEHSYTTYDGGAFYGMAVGIGGLNGYEIMEGLAKLLYIDPSGNAGIAEGDLAGIYDEANYKFLLLSDNITGYQKAENIGVSPEMLYDSIHTTMGSGYMYGDSIDAYEELRTMCIANYDESYAQNWGIYDQRFTSGYIGSEGEWAAHMGGKDAFGAYTYIEQSLTNNLEGTGPGQLLDDYGYWVADITEGTAENGWLSAKLNGKFVTRYKMGTLSGDILGVYNMEGGLETAYGEGSWQGVGIGVWEGTPLTLSGYLDHGYNEDSPGLYYNNGGMMEFGSNTDGLLGSVDSPLYGVYGFNMMGEYEDYGSQSIWRANIAGDDAAGGSYAYYGFVSGLWDDDLVDAYITAIYMNDQGEAGYLTGEAKGRAYPGIDMWMVEGTLQSEIMASEMESNDISAFLEYISYGSLSGEVYGSESESYYMSGSSYSGSTYYLAYEDWGIYNIAFGSENTYGNYDGRKTWWADIYGEGMFGNFYGYQGIMKGKFHGLHDGEGTWIGNSSGIWYAIDTAEEYGEYGVYAGFMNGVWDENGIMTGNMIAIYDQSPGAWLEETFLSIPYEGGLFYGGFNGGSDMYLYDLNGKFYNFSGKDWGIWRANLAGESYSQGGILKLFMAGDMNYDNDGYMVTDGYWFGVVAGVQVPGFQKITGIFRGLSLSFIGDGMSNVSLDSGDMVGAIYDIDGEYNIWEMAGLGTSQNIGTIYTSPEGTSDFTNNFIMEGDVNMSGAGRFIDGGEINIEPFGGNVYNIQGEKDGIWINAFSGTCSDPTESFDIALYGIGGENTYRYILAEAKGEMQEPVLSGTFDGIWIGLSEEQYGALSGGVMTGEMVGYIDVEEEGVCSLQAVAAGEWVEAESLLNTTDINTLNTSIQELASAVNIPITEVYSVVNMTGVGTGGITSAVMDINLYALQPNMLQGIWASIINGAYSNIESPAGWTATVVNGGDTATLLGTNWGDGQWAANVSGTVGGNAITGQAGGTYSGEGSGTFTGVGAGTWNAPGVDPIQPPQQDPS